MLLIAMSVQERRMERVRLSTTMKTTMGFVMQTKLKVARMKRLATTIPQRQMMVIRVYCRSVVRGAREKPMGQVLLLMTSVTLMETASVMEMKSRVARMIRLVTTIAARRMTVCHVSMPRVTAMFALEPRTAPARSLITTRTTTAFATVMK